VFKTQSVGKYEQAEKEYQNVCANLNDSDCVDKIIHANKGNEYFLQMIKNDNKVMNTHSID
jgi:hypothetical protein